ncbi:unnamed protein product [Acanthoscelides obtectus]|uniref:Uncharacterized protein n=1 Tax=Acanthoscelides obtectus TaxID=200917 RepID=A0A9P0QJM3_ACAOB|nr:unnamed protein product [Acanthoscelides obtectus]CAK1686309.1 hypothetical protein AOBTE_LOCUS35914 [Acanthoscelides obtectus]
MLKWTPPATIDHLGTPQTEPKTEIDAAAAERQPLRRKLGTARRRLASVASQKLNLIIFSHSARRFKVLTNQRSNTSVFIWNFTLEQLKRCSSATSYEI